VTQAIHLIRVGDGVDLAMLDNLAAALARVFSISCHVEEDVVDASTAFDHRRGQHYSTAILGMLTLRNPPPQTRLLGITDHDLFVPVLTFVFGEAQLHGNCALVSYHRLRDSFYGLPDREGVLDERLAKEAVHELGHTFGLRHCEDWRCVMSSSHAVEVLDLKGAGFCRSCRACVQ
jgi:archaemetzincin